MKVFISWSGERGRQLGEAIREWLPTVLQSVEPYFSPSDIDKGAKWDSDITQALKSSNVGLIIVTHDSLKSQWTMFEAGALARSVEKTTRVCPMLFDVKKSEVTGPLTSFQMADFTQQEVQRVLATVNKVQEKGLDDAALAKAFEKWWPDLETKVKSILAATQSIEPAAELRSDRELLEENLLLTRQVVAQQEESTIALRDLFPRMPVYSPFGLGPGAQGPTLMELIAMSPEELRRLRDSPLLPLRTPPPKFSPSEPDDTNR